MYCLQSKQVTPVVPTQVNYFVPCTLTTEFAYICTSDKFYRQSWLVNRQHNLDLDQVLVTNKQVAATVPNSTVLCNPLIGRLKQRLVEIYLNLHIVVPEHQTMWELPLHVFIQRCNSKTIDLILIYPDEFRVISAIPKDQITLIQQWHNRPIFCAEHVLPVASLFEALVHQRLTYEQVCTELTTCDDSDSDWLPGSETESETESERDSDCDDII